MKKTNTKSNARPNTNDDNARCVLKNLHDDIVRSTGNETLTTKMMRVWLRANMRDAHVHNASWTFNQKQYDVARSHFDPKYRASIDRASKRNTKSNATPRKRVAKTNDVNVTPEPVA